MNRESVLVLFDIDGTLLDLHGAGRLAIARSLEHCFGWKTDLKSIRLAGATDHDLLHKISRDNGHTPTAEDERAFFERMPVELEAAMNVARLVLHPGVKPLLEKLSADPRCLLGLVTGNIESCAWFKLRLFDLHDHFVLGAFGHEHGDRNEIARLALGRALARTGREFGKIFLIGDTPNDVRAAKTIGAKAIAVATGSFTHAELVATGADVVLDDLGDLDAVLKLLGLAAV